MKPEIMVVMPLNQPTMEALAESFTLHKLWEAKDKSSFYRGIKDKVEGIATFGGPLLTAEMMDQLPKLKIISTMSVGVDHIDLAAARDRGIKVTNAPDVLTDDVADIGIGLMMAVARRLVVGDRHVRTGQWLKSNLPLARKLGGARLGVLGLGRIGLAVAKRAEALGMKIAYHGPREKAGLAYRYYPDLVEMARNIDYLMVVCPGGAATRHLVNAKVIAALGPEGVVVNIARGSVIDEEALVAALVAGKLGGAGLDVFADEPRVPEALFGLDTVVLQPHIGSATHETRRAMGQLMIDNLLAHYAGKPLLTPVV